jgi:hypothetical protein
MGQACSCRRRPKPNNPQPALSSTQDVGPNPTEGRTGTVQRRRRRPKTSNPRPSPSSTQDVVLEGSSGSSNPTEGSGEVQLVERSATKSTLVVPRTHNPNPSPSSPQDSRVSPLSPSSRNSDSPEEVVQDAESDALTLVATRTQNPSPSPSRTSHPSSSPSLPQGDQEVVPRPTSRNSNSTEEVVPPAESSDALTGEQPLHSSPETQNSSFYPMNVPAGESPGFTRSSDSGSIPHSPSPHPDLDIGAMENPTLSLQVPATSQLPQRLGFGNDDELQPSPTYRPLPSCLPPIPLESLSQRKPLALDDSLNSHFQDRPSLPPQVSSMSDPALDTSHSRGQEDCFTRFAGIIVDSPQPLVRSSAAPIIDDPTPLTLQRPAEPSLNNSQHQSGRFSPRLVRFDGAHESLPRNLVNVARRDPSLFPRPHEDTPSCDLSHLKISPATPNAAPRERAYFSPTPVR